MGGRQVNKDSRTGPTVMTNPTDLDAQVTEYHRLASRAECLSVDLVLRMATLAAAQERLRMTLERSIENGVPMTTGKRRIEQAI